jgi:DNA-binding transcriptional ArsR family regulator
MTAIDILYGDDLPHTATELATATGVSASAMSYHLRSLERHGIVRRSDASNDGRERPWERTAQELSVAIRGETSARVGAAVTDAVLSTAMDADRAALVAAQQRQLRNDRSVPLDRAARYNRRRIVVTPKEARELYKQIDRLVDAYRPEKRATVPKGAGAVTVTVLGIAENATDTAAAAPRTRSRP